MMRRALSPSVRDSGKRRHAQRNGRFAGAVRGLALCAAAYVFVWRGVDPVGWFYGEAPLFAFSAEFIQPLLGFPGGLLQLGAAFLGQLAFHAELGALVVMIIAGLTWLSTSWLAGQTGRSAPILSAVPAWLVLFLFSRYTPGALEFAGGVLVTVLCASAWNRWSASSPGASGGTGAWAGFACFSGLTILLFYAAGPMFSLLFVILGALREALWHRQARSAAACSSWLVPWAGAVVLWSGVDPAGVLTRLDGSLTLLGAAALYGWVPLIWLGNYFREVWRRRARAASVPHLSAAPAGRRNLLAPAATVLAALAGFALLALSMDWERRAFLRIQSGAERAQWEQVLVAANGLEPLPPPARLHVFRALWHRGRLHDDLFCFPQRHGVPLLASLSDGLDVCVPLADTLLELGHVNLAERSLHEALEIEGERPAILWRIGWVNLVKERPEAARVFLNRLARVPFHRAQAQRWLAAIDRDPSLASEPEVARARALRVTEDVYERHFSTSELLRMAMQRRNPMAADYALAHLLLQAHPEELARTLKASGQTRSPRELPRHLAEALLRFNQATSGGQLGGGQFEPALEARWRAFGRALGREPQDASCPSPPFTAAFGDTYWFYERFGATPGGFYRRKQP